MKIPGCCVSILTFLMCHWLILTVITNTTQGSQAIYSKCTPFNTLKIIRNKEPRKNNRHSEHVYIFFSDHTLSGQYCQICTVHAVECSQSYTWLALFKIKKCSFVLILKSILSGIPVKLCQDKETGCWKLGLSWEKWELYPDVLQSTLKHALNTEFLKMHVCLYMVHYSSYIYDGIQE